MRPITIKILNNFSDSYFYMGKLFILTEDRQLKFINNDKFYKKYLQNGNSLINHWLEKVLFSNESLPSYKDFKSNTDDVKTFNCFWEVGSDKKFEFQIEEDDLTFICKLPENESLDFIIYAERAYLANRDGLFECQLSIDGENVLVLSDGFQRVFDSKSINLNPRAGKVLVSTKSDGLFVGSIEDRNELIRITENQIASSSLRTGWAEYNFVNYDSTIGGNFFKNETEEYTNEALNFNIEDGSRQNKKIKEIGTEQISLSDMFSNRKNNEKIIFSFNSLTNSFNISESGTILINSFGNNDNYRVLNKVKFDLANLGYPLSAYTVPNGTVYEFFEKVILVRNGHMNTISEIECKQIRTFASSKWYQNIIMALSDDFLEIHSIPPIGF